MRNVFPVTTLFVWFVFVSTQMVMAVTVSSNATVPASNVFVSHDWLLGDSFAEPWSWTGNTGNNHRDIGQSFLVPGAEPVQLGAVTLRAREVGSSVPGSPFHIETWTVTDAFDGIGDVLVDTQTGVLPNSGLLASSYWTFDVAPISLAGGGRYAFILAFDTGPDAQRFVNFVEDFNSGYTEGRWLARNDTPTNWSSITNDAIFFLQSEPPAPEPSSYMLLGFGALGLVRQARRLRDRA